MQHDTHPTNPRSTDTRHGAARRVRSVTLALAVGAALLAACGDEEPTTTASTGDAPDRPVAIDDGSAEPAPDVAPVEPASPTTPTEPTTPDAGVGDPPATPVGGPSRPPAPSPAAPVTTPAPPAAPVPVVPPAEIEDGRHFGYLVRYELDATATVAAFDLARFLTGDEADAAAAEDGVIASGDEIENDYYIRNTDPALRRLIFRDDAAVTVVRCSAGCSSVPADRATLQNRPTPTPVWVTVEGGVVVAADEQYLP